MLAQHAHTQRMKGANQHPAPGFAYQRLAALLHFSRSLVGKGNRSNRLRSHARGNQSADFVGNYARFAGTGPCQHQAGASEVIDRFLLSSIQAAGIARGSRRRKRRGGS